MGKVVVVHNVDLVSIWCSLLSAGVLPKPRMGCKFDHVIRSNDLLLVETRPDVDNEYHEEHDHPAAEGTDSAPDPSLVKDKVTDEDGHKDLRHPEHEIVEAACTDSE